MQFLAAFCLTLALPVRCYLPMFVREKTINGYTYLYLVENKRERANKAAHHP